MARLCPELPDLRPKLHSGLIAIKAIIGLSPELLPFELLQIICFTELDYGNKPSSYLDPSMRRWRSPLPPTRFILTSPTARVLLTARANIQLNVAINTTQLS